MSILTSFLWILGANGKHLGATKALAMGYPFFLIKSVERHFQNHELRRVKFAAWLSKWQIDNAPQTLHSAMKRFTQAQQSQWLTQH